MKCIVLNCAVDVVGNGKWAD